MLRSYDFVDVVNKTIISLPFVGYEMIIRNSAPPASWATCYLISNARSCLQFSYLFVFFSLEIARAMEQGLDSIK